MSDVQTRADRISPYAIETHADVDLSGDGHIGIGSYGSFECKSNLLRSGTNFDGLNNFIPRCIDDAEILTAGASDPNAAIGAENEKVMIRADRNSFDDLMDGRINDIHLLSRREKTSGFTHILRLKQGEVWVDTQGGTKPAPLNVGPTVAWTNGIRQ